MTEMRSNTMVASGMSALTRAEREWYD
jgi:hypothetical protein